MVGGRRSREQQEGGQSDCDDHHTHSNGVFKTLSSVLSGFDYAEH